MRSRNARSGFFGKKRLMIVAVAAGAVVLGIALILLLRLTEPNAPDEVAQNPIATITMQNGSEIHIELYPDQAPNTVANFVSLANSRFYDGQQFFRVVAGVFIQGGDPNNNGTGDPGYAIRGEFAENGFTQNTLSHMRGVISMARPSGYDAAGSQFFIMQGSYPEYDGRYAAFGRISDDKSLAVLDSIASQPTDTTYLPLTRQVISTIRVETYGVNYKPEKIDRQ